MAINKALLYLGALLACSIATAVPINENTSITTRLGGAIQYNDNIFLDSQDEESDTIWIFSPGVELDFGQEPSNANLNVVYVHDFATYSDNKRLNRDSPDAKLSGYYRTVKSNIQYGLAYKENSQNDAGNNLAGDLARRDILTGYADGEWDVTAKSSVSAGYNLQQVKYDTPRFHDRDTYAIPVDYYWAVSPKMDMSVGYRFRNTSFERGRQFILDNPADPFNFRPDYDDQFVSVGVRGQIGAKTVAQVRMGVQNRDFNISGVKDADLFAANASVSWEATEKSRINLLVSRDFDADAFGTSIERSDIQIAGATELNENLSGFASIRFSNDDYTGGRSDNGVFGQVGVTLSPTSYSSVTLAYVVYNNDSDFEAADFSNNVINLSGTLRY